jgi:hypothetical protein
MSLPPDKRPKQTPFTRAEGSGDVILAPHPELGRKVESAPTTSSDSKGIHTNQTQSGYQLLGRKRYRTLIPIIAAAVVVGTILVLLTGSTHNNNLTNIVYNAGFNNGTQTALADTQNGRLFNPSCDPTGVHASGGQHPTPFCSGWTSGYISEWKNKHPDWNSGNITSWKPNNPPDNRTVVPCTQCASKLKPIVRFVNGTNDGGQAALDTLQNNGQFDPACDPTRAHTSDGLHTTVYCNGWTSGYIYSWTTKLMPTTVHLVAQNLSSVTSHPTTSVVNHKKPSPTLALLCKNKSGNNLICTYTNSTP